MEKYFSGCAPGVHIGPLIFLIFVNELASIPCNSHVDMFADDSTLEAIADTSQALQLNLNEDYTRVDSWCKSNELVLNKEKTHVIISGTNQFLSRHIANADIKISDGSSQDVEHSEHEKLLGIVISNNLSWSKFFYGDEENTGLFKALSKRVSSIQCLCKFTSIKSLKCIANGIFISKLSYGMPIWGGAPNTYIKTLQILQNKVMRSILNCDFRTPTLYLLSNMGWLSVKQLIIYHTIIQFYKILSSHQPQSIFNQLNFNYNNYHMSTRAMSRNDVILDIKRLQLTKSAFIYRASVNWNSLPLSLRSVSNFLTFKTSLKSYIKHNITPT